MNHTNVFYIGSKTEITKLLNGQSSTATKIVPTESASFTYQDLHQDGSGRSWINGVMDLTIIREDLMGIDLTFENIEHDTFIKYLRAMKNRSKNGFYVYLYDEIQGKYVMKHMYRGDRTYTESVYGVDERYTLVNFSVSWVEF